MQLFLFEKQSIFAQISTMDKKCLLLTFLLLLITISFFQSCATKRNLVYFSNLSDSTIYKEEIANRSEPKIQPGDALAIKISTLSPESNILYSSGSLPLMTPNGNNGGGLPTGASNSATLSEGYLVDKNGQIDFPILGKVTLGGLTIEQAREMIAGEVSKTDRNPIVNISFLNFKVTVIGEVLHPGSFNIPNSKVNILEALGMAGDLTSYAKRNNVLVIRETNGVRTMQRIDLNDKKVFNSPYYYLQQNDVVYVQPENKLKAAQAADPSMIRTIPIISTSISLLAIILSRLL